MKFSPKVSIVIPVYNGSNYLAEAIDSALAQTYKNIEVIVINDGSNDNGATEKIAKSYGNKIRYYKKENGGVATALNMGIEKMTGEYFSWLSHDDMYKPEKIKKQIKLLNKLKNSGRVILYSNYELINNQSKRIGKCNLNHNMLSKTQIYSLLRGSVNGITMLIPKTAFDKCGEFDVSLRCTQDYDMWLRMIDHYEFIHMEDALSFTRIHPLQDTQSSPSAIEEGDKLWIKMVNSLSDDSKKDIEGSVFRFYLEMIKFVKQTPYAGALSYLSSKLEDAAKNIIFEPDELLDVDRLYSVYDELVESNQKRALSYYFNIAIKQMIKKNKEVIASKIIVEKFIGEQQGIGVEYVDNHYLPKIKDNKVRPRIMFCTGHWLTGGMERVLSNLFKELKDDYDIFLLTAFDGRLGVIELPDYVTHIKMSNDIFYHSYEQSALTNALLLDIDIVIGFMNLFNGQLDFYELSLGTGLKTVASNNEMYFYPYHNPYYYGLIDKRTSIFKKLDATLWCTNFSAASYGLVGENSYLMPNPNTYKVQPTAKKNKTENIILCVGRFNDYVKRVDRMLQCFELVSRKHADAKMIFVGKYDMGLPIDPSSDITLGEFIQGLRIDKSKIEFIGEVGNVSDYYKKAKVLLVTSMSEGFGMVINEAACFGVPTVCNKIPGIEDLIINGKNGFIVEQDNIQGLADSVCNILEDRTIEKKLGVNALKHVSNFDEKIIADRWRYLINTLIDDTGTHKKLKEKLSYSILDKNDFSRLIFNELNGVVSVTSHAIEDIQLLLDQPTHKFLYKKIKKDYGRYIRSLDKYGLYGTGKMMARMVYSKIYRGYKK